MTRGGQRGTLAVVMVVLIAVVGVVNFAAQFVVAGYHTDPWITYIFMGTAATIAGVALPKLPIRRRKDSEPDDRED